MLLNCYVVFSVQKVTARLAEKRGMDIQVADCPADDMILIRHLRDGVTDDELILYFEDCHNCPSGGDVVNVQMYHNNSMAIVQFSDIVGLC